ncbi:unnamed protein product [Caenorhabditis auriculariae]|uniref:Uncharacterized protein n=1 Tax=Caenorhabditis auriculariae TaxID=2777116 RepID=A0A8S1H0D3_9PELO|nr:unnamed protein product [Caenorhabditis auriculariae]
MEKLGFKGKRVESGPTPTLPEASRVPLGPKKKSPNQRPKQPLLDRREPFEERRILEHSRRFSQLEALDREWKASKSRKTPPPGSYVYFNKKAEYRSPAGLYSTNDQPAGHFVRYPQKARKKKKKTGKRTDWAAPHIHSTRKEHANGETQRQGRDGPAAIRGVAPPPVSRASPPPHPKAFPHRFGRPALRVLFFHFSTLFNQNSHTEVIFLAQNFLEFSQITP